MRRIPIQFDEETYQFLKRRAFEEGKSIAAVVREFVSRQNSTKQYRSIDDFSFIGSGRARGRKERTSEEHDEALADAFDKSKRRRR